MKKRLLLLIFCLAPLWMQASHIVGGEFELIWIEGTRYRLNLILYFDSINGDAGALDPSVTARIYRKSDDAFMRSVFLPLIKIKSVSYTQPECSDGQLITRYLLYSDSVVVLNPTQFNHPGGYYVSWQRCCRNYVITNVKCPRVDNVTNPQVWAGQTFYLEFPAILTPDGQPFIDSTPRLFPPLNDYACPYRPYYSDFGGIDNDGDSLVYSMVTPLNTKQPAALPTPDHGPYPNVTWQIGFGLTHIMNGSPDLRISRDGLLTVTPGGAQGLYAFAVKVEEFRNHVKIGETRRDFQMLVVADCPVADPPQIVGRELGGSYTNAETLSISFNRAEPDATRCIQVRISDNDSMDQDQGYLERVKIKAVALNFRGDLSPIIPTSSYATLVNGSSIEYTICFPKCPYLFGGTPEIGIVAMDDACSLPLTDTLKVAVYVEAPLNNLPRVTSVSPFNVPPVDEGSAPQTWPFSFVDDDGDPLTLSLLTNGFVFATAGMSFQTLSHLPGAIGGELTWDPNCLIYDFTHRTSFQVTFRVDDQDQCLAPGQANAIYNLTLQLPPNADPIIDSDLTANPLERSLNVTRRLFQDLDFNVNGHDADDDLLVLSTQVFPMEADLPSLNLAPPPVTANSSVTTPINLPLECETVDFSQRDSANYLVRFIVVDKANKCRIYKADTLDVNLLVLPPLNERPSLSVFNGNPTETTFSDNTVTMTRGTSISLTLTGTDMDVTPQHDGLRLQLADQKSNVMPPAQYSFTPVEGTSPVQAAFTWTPDCSIFRKGEASKEYQLSFELVDDHCQTGKKDSAMVRIVVNDINGSDAVFQPPNFVSPNGDDKNDYYAMERLIPETGVLENILPLDNCSSRFEFVRIVNRWGKQVFESSDRDFKWFPGDTPPGTYYYTIKFSAKEYKGALTVMY